MESKILKKGGRRLIKERIMISLDVELIQALNTFCKVMTDHGYPWTKSLLIEKALCKYFETLNTTINKEDKDNGN